jgi:hypothetical protein
MSADQVVIGFLSVALVGLVALALVLVRENQKLEAAARCKALRQEARWQATLDAVIEDWGDECDGLITQIGDLKEQIAAQAYVIGALKTQVRDSQQAGMQMQIEREQLFQIADIFLYGMDETWEQTGVCQAALTDWHGFVARWHQEHPLSGAKERLAAYANAGKVVEGLPDSNIPY